MEQVTDAACLEGQRDVGRGVTEAADHYGYSEAAEKLCAWIERREKEA